MRASTPSTRSSSSTRRARPASRRACCTPPPATSPARTSRTKYVFDLRPERHLLVHRRRRLGHRAQLPRLRPALERRDVLDVRRRAQLPRLGPLLAHHRAARRHDPLHRAHRDPRVHPLRATSGRRRATSRACACSARVGEPINPEAWIWYHKVIGGDRCPIVDTWWQTETGSIMMTTLPGAASRSRARRACRSSASSPTS